MYAVATYDVATCDVTTYDVKRQRQTRLHPQRWTW